MAGLPHVPYHLLHGSPLAMPHVAPSPTTTSRAPVPSIKSSGMPVPPVIPSKRDDDEEVQFVSSKPVKKQKTDHPQNTTVPPKYPFSHSTGAATMKLTTAQAHAASSAPPVSKAAPPATSTGHNSDNNNVQPEERRLSAGNCAPPAATSQPQDESGRCSSVPATDTSFFAHTLWTAPRTRRRSSPALSPKELPQRISPVCLNLSNDRKGKRATQRPSTVERNNTEAATASLKPRQTQPQLQQTAQPSTPVIHGEQKKAPDLPAWKPVADDQQGFVPRQIGQAGDYGVLFGNEMGLHENESKNQQQNTTDSSLPCHWTGTQGQTEPYFPSQRTFGLPLRPQQSPKTSTHQSSEPHLPTTASQITSVTAAAATTTSASQPKPFHVSPSGHATSVSQPAIANATSSDSTNHQHGNTENGICGGASKSMVKGPCRKCLEKRLRQQAALYNSLVSLPNSQHNPVTQQITQLPPKLPITPWPQANISPYPAHLAPPQPAPLAFGQVFNSQPMGSISLQIPNYTGNPVMNSQATMSTSTPTPLGGGTQAFMPAAASQMSQMSQASTLQQAHSQTRNQKRPDMPPLAGATTSAALKPSPATVSTQPNGKHITVDIAETCVEIFPFEAMAKRHNQPVKKIHDIFDAVIQLPLLRCPTDKRRAGKLGTTRVKEFHQARKEMLANSTGPTPGQGGSEKQSGWSEMQGQNSQQPQQFSAWELAQFMGPLDMRAGNVPSFTGPW